MSHGVHATASLGFGRAGADYERGRPGYPAAAIEHLAGTLGLRGGRTVLDLAAGTGKLTRELTRTGAEVIAVEPVGGMREQLVAAALGARVMTGSAERIPLADAGVDAVTVAQAFHWFGPRAAAAEIHRVLRPEGRLAVIWNAWDIQVPWVAAVQEIVHAHRANTPQQSTSRWRDELDATALFTPLDERTFSNLVTGDRATLVARIVSTSYIAALDATGRDQVARDLLAVVDRDPATAGHAELEMPYTTWVWSGQRC